MNGAKDQHWSHLVSETTLAFSPDCTPDTFPLPVAGGSEYGHFCLVGDRVKHNKLIYHLGPKLHSDDIILEVQGLKVAGYTSNDLREWLISAAQNSNPMLIKTAKSGTLKKELRPYLNYGFAKGSVDHDTQMTIRENLFQRTVPCTTRPPREGEVNGVDYTFVSLEEFKALEKSGNLLECGGFDGNYYGMPKPPVAKLPIGKETNAADVKPGAHPSSKGKRQRNRSTIEATSNKNHPIDNTVHSAHIPGTDIVMTSPTRGPSRGPTDRTNVERAPHEKPPSPTPQNIRKPELAPPSAEHRPPYQLPANGQTDVLPSNWEVAFTADGHMYYIDPSVSLSESSVVPVKASSPNPAAASPSFGGSVTDPPSSVHNTETTHWTHPISALPTSKQSTPLASPTEELPYGWEKVDDPHYGVYFIDHLNKKTQYDSPNRPADDKGLISPSPSAKSVKSTPSYRDPDSVSQQHAKAFFTKNPDELSGERLSTILTKSLRGFGFTIVGGDERDEEFLQIKNVVPNGPADQDGLLKTGDVLVKVNNKPVLGYTHSDVVSMFQTIKPDERVKLEVCRGYPLTFDPNDPNTEIVTKIAVSMPKQTPAQAKKREVERAAKDEGDNSSLDEFADSLLHDITSGDGAHLPAAGSTSDMNTSGHMFSIEIVRGQSGFGFTIADSVHGQKVKHILDPGRCKTLQEGDILVKIAGTNVMDMEHLEVVDVLKSCPQGHATEIVVQRGGSKKVPRPPSQSRTHEDSNGPSPLSTPELGEKRRMKFITGADSSDTAASSDNQEAASHVIVRPTATSNKPGMFKWSVNGSQSQLYRTNRQSSSSLANREDDDSEGQRTPPPLPSKGRLNSDASMKENSLPRTSRSSLTEAPSSIVLPSQLRDSANIVNNYQAEEKARSPTSNGPTGNMSAPGPGMLPAKQILGQHPLMNQYNPYYQPPKESFYDIPSKYRTDSSNMTAQQRFDMMSVSSRTEHVSRSQNSSQPHESRRSRTPGPEHMRTPPDRSTDDRFRSKTPNPGDHRSRSGQNNLNHPPSTMPGVTSFENSTPMPSSQYPAPPPGWKEQWQTLDVYLRRGDQGFGFRIVGGPEEDTQVAIGYIVPGGIADQDRRLKTGDEIIRVDGRSTFGESHHIVVALMGQASSTGHVNLGIRRRVLVQDASPTKSAPIYNTALDKHQPYDVIVSRREHEGFGFIIVSSLNRVGAVVGRIIENSPAERCGMLRVGDRIIAVNDVDISRMLHEDIVNLIKDSGYSVKLVVAPPAPSPTDKRPNGSMTSATALPTMSDNETLVRNMNSHTAIGTADRYNGGAPLQNSKSAGNLSGNASLAQSYGSRSDSRLPSSSSGGAPPSYNDYGKHSYAPAPRPLSSYEPPHTPSYNSSPQRPSYNHSPRQAYETPMPTYEPPRPGYDPSKLGIRTPIVPPGRQANSGIVNSAPNTQTTQPAPGSILNIELMRSSRGFGFSIRGGREFNNMPLYVLRIAEEGAAYMDQRLLVGDEILEINDQPTNGMSHAEAINLIQSGGSKVKLLVRRTGQLPNIVSEQGIPSPQGSGLSSPAIRNSAPTSQQSTAYDPSQNYNKDRYGMPARADSQVDGKYNPAGYYRPEVIRPELNRADSSRSGMGRGIGSNRVDVKPGYQAERYNAPASAGSRYSESGQQRGYPVGRDNIQQGKTPLERQSSNPYPPQNNSYVPPQHNSYSPYPSQQTTRPQQSTYNSTQNNLNRPYNNSIVSKPPTQYNGPTSSPSYKPPANSTQYNNNSKPASHQPPAPYPNNSAGAYRPPPAGSYNAGAMNRQTNLQMYNYYDANKPVNQAVERQPPVGQNSFDSRSSAPTSNYPSSYNAHNPAPNTYKAMDYGPQGMIRSTTSSVASNARTMYSGQGGPIRPPYNNYDPPISNNYYSRQPAYQ